MPSFSLDIQGTPVAPKFVTTRYAPKGAAHAVEGLVKGGRCIGMTKFNDGAHAAKR